MCKPGRLISDHASRLWDRAEERRAIAGITPDEKLGADYLKLADPYLDLAAKEEELARRREKQEQHVHPAPKLNLGVS